MKHLLRKGTSILLAVVMLVSVFIGPLSVAPISFAGGAKGVGDTLAIDFNYAKNNGISTAAKARSAIIGYQSADKSENAALYNSIASAYNWKHVARRDVFYKSSKEKYNEFQDYVDSAAQGWDSMWDWMLNEDDAYKECIKLWTRYEDRVGYYVTDTAFNELKPALESKAESDKYIVLDSDFTYHNLYNLPGTIKITTDKVLDLNGHNIYLNDITNRAFASGRQNDHAYAHNSKMFEITGNGSLTIIDSSTNSDGESKGGIYTNHYMTDVFGYEYNYYTSRDIFWVDNGGRLVIYGGTFQAGRYKHQREAALTWDDVKKVAGAAVDLGINVAEYAYGIKGAQAALQDQIESYAQNAISPSDEGGGLFGSIPASEGGSNAKKDGSDGKEETKVDKPQSEIKRNMAVAEKAQKKNEEIEQNNAQGGMQKPTEPENKANSSKSAKEENKEGKEVKDPDKPKDGKNVTLNNLEKNITDAALDKGKLSAMAESAMNFCNAIADLFTADGPRLVQSTLGTVAHIGSGGTLVTYGGKFIGTGSTANTRNAVIEVVEQMGSANTYFNGSNYDSKLNGGLAYIYGGDFDAQTGANVFNIVKSNTGEITGRYQTVMNPNGTYTDQAVTIHASEVYGGTPIGIYDGQPVTTKNITVRGGNFNCSAEIAMAGLWTDNQVTMFPGTAGCVNLGVESYGEEYIKDGRIQIRDTYGDGALVLMDENRDENEQMHHYRLFCSPLELRYNAHLQVSPGNPEANTTRSFHLISTKGERDANSTLKELKKSWQDDSEGSERNSAFADNEQYFELPVNPDGYTAQSTTDHYYIIPSTGETDDDVYGEKFAGSKLWYYSTPLDTKAKPIETFTFSNLYRNFKVYNKDGSVYADNLRFTERRRSDKYYASDNDWRWQVLSEDAVSYQYLSNLKWFRYQVYRVDPLSRESLSTSSKYEGNSLYGRTVPLADIVYGASNDSLRCMLPLTELEAYMKDFWGYKKDIYGNYYFRGFQPGEMYRVVFSVDESLSYYFENGTSPHVSLDTASMTSSIVFTCYDEKKETKTDPNDSNKLIGDFTPLQWEATPEAGQVAKVNIVNGKAGQTDITNKKIFDVYYQWFAVDNEGNETLIAGTNDIYKGSNLEELSRQTVSNINHATANKGGYLYKNTIDPANPAAANYDENGMPKDTDAWTCEDFHAYTYWMMGTTHINELLFGNNSTRSLKTNYSHIFETGSDSCYIPESAAGKTVYCKATVVNSYWPLNYDHVQVFTSHKVKLQAKQYTVLVEDANGFTENIVSGGEKFTLPAGFESPYLGMEFDRWNIGNPGDEITVTGDMRISAVWKERVAETAPRVKFVAGEGSGTMNTVTFSESGKVYKLPDSSFTRPAGKAFTGWEVTDSLGNVLGTYAKGDNISVNQTLICTAQYASFFRITKAESAEAEHELIVGTWTIGKTYTLPEIPAGWATINGNQVADSWNYGAPGETITFTAEMYEAFGDRLVLAWHSLPEVSFDAGVGSGTMASVFVQGNYTLPACTLTAPGTCYFKCWSVGGKSYDPGESITVNANTVVSAKWAADISFDANGGSGTVPDVAGLKYAYYGQSFTLPENFFKAPDAGLEFNGWNLGNPGDTITVKGALNLYPEWTGKSISVIFKDKDGYLIDLNTYDYGDSIVMPAYTGTIPEGKAFQGWRADTGMYASDLQPGQRITVRYFDTQNKLTFTPFFSDGCVVRFDLNGHQMVYGASVADRIVPYGTTIALPTADDAGDYAVHDHIFKGWFTEAACEHAFTAETPVTKNITLYAKWVPGYTVRFYKNYDLLATMDVEAGETITPPIAPVSAGEEFQGWYNGVSGDIADFSTFTPDEDVSFFASYVDLPQISLSEYNEAELVRSNKYTFYGFLLHSENLPAGKEFKWESSDPAIVSIVPDYEKDISWSSYVYLKVADDAPFNAKVTITFSAGDYKVSQEVHIRETFPLKVGGVEVTEKNRRDVFGDGNVSFDGDHTLTLLGGTYENGIQSQIPGLVIETIGNCTFKGDGNEEEYHPSYCSFEGDTTFTGKGKLTINGWLSGEEGALRFSGETLTIDNTTLIITGEYGMIARAGYEPAKKLVVKNSDITIHTGTSEWGGYAIAGFEGGYTLTDCRVTTPANATFKYDALYDTAKDDYATDAIITSNTAHTHNHKALVTAPTCTAQGYTTYTCDCGDTYKGDYTDALAHTVATQAAVAPTCQAEGKTEGSYCSVCGTVLKAQETVAKVGHTLVIDPEMKPTCLKTGKSVGSHCAICGTVFAEQETLEKGDHTVVTDKAVPASCTESGKTAGSHCAVCGTVITAQKTIPALGHTEATRRENEMAASCTEEGYYDEVTYCSECDAVLDREFKSVKKLSHREAPEVIENMTEGTCLARGSYDEVIYCADCGTELSRDTRSTPKGAHTPGEVVIEKDKASTCSVAGSYDEVTYCDVCGEEMSRVTKAKSLLGHTPAAAVRENEKAATCLAEGSYDEVVRCAVCQAELSRATKVIATLEHTPAAAVKENEKAASCTANGSYDNVVKCSVCGTELSRESVSVAMKAHSFKNTKVVKPTTVKAGYTDQKCSACGKKQRLITAPTGKVKTLKCKTRTASAETMTWSAVKGAEGYQIQISSADGKSWGKIYNAKKATSFTIKGLSAGGAYLFRVRIFAKGVDGKYAYGAWTKAVISPTLPAGTSLTKVTGASKAFTAQWKQNKTVNGYQLQYSTDKSFKKGVKTVNVSGNAKLSATVKKLSAKKDYFVRVRTFKTISKVNYYSAWSKVLKVKTK